MKLDSLLASVLVVDVDSSDEQFDGCAVGRVEVTLTVSLRSTDVVVVLRRCVATFSHVDAHRAAGRRQLDHRRLRTDERLRRQVPVVRLIPACRRRVNLQPGSEAVDRHSDALSGLRAEPSRAGDREGRRSRVWRRLIVEVVFLFGVVAVWIAMTTGLRTGQHEAECVD